MNKFIVTYANGVVHEEWVQDCDTVDAYINRKFGSADPHEFGVKVTMESLDEQAHGEKDTGVVGPKTGDKPDAKMAAETKPVAEPTKAKGYVLKAETGVIGATLSEVE